MRRLFIVPIFAWGTEDLRCPIALILLVLLSFPVRAELRFAQPILDAGQVRGGPALVQRFHFLNDGTQSIEITDTRPGCGCLKPRLPKRQFGPSEEGWIEVEINTLTQPAGPNQWRVQIFYRNGDEPRETILQVNAQLTKEVLVEPAALTISTEQGITREITVTDLRAKPLTITSAQASAPQLRCQLEEARRDAGGRVVQVVRLEIGADYPEGRREEMVSLYTDDAAYRELRVPVSVAKRAKQRIAATPREVTVTVPQGQPIPSRILLLRDAENHPVIVEHVTADDPAISCRWAEGPDKMATVKVQVDAVQLHNRSVRSVLHIQVRLPIEQMLDVPITINADATTGKRRTENGE